MPTWPYVGRQPTRKVETPISRMVPIMHLLAAEPVADVAHEEGADRPGDVRDAEGRERGDGRGGVVALREEDVREDQRGGGAVDREVVVLEGAAEPGGEGGLARGPGGRFAGVLMRSSV